VRSVGITSLCKTLSYSDLLKRQTLAEAVKSSSARFKNDIKPMDRASEAILALEPVTFRYKPDLDPNGVPQFGLVAEQVEKVNPDLVVRGQDGKVNTVRYEAVNAMLLNEFLKAHRKLDQQQAMIDR
jgi:trimeric autotransporter adhesin